MIKFVIVRHGESVWNLENKFTGWTDVDLSDKGVLEAEEAGKILKENGFHFDIAFTSYLLRARRTLDIILSELHEDVLIKSSYKLNERHYGALQGLNKDEMRKKYGEEQVKLWRRSFLERPPLLDVTDERFPGNDEKYKDISKDLLPRGENLEDTVKRVTEYWNSDIKPVLLSGKRVIIVAHGNSLRALCMYLDNLTPDEVMNLEFKTGAPICYECDDNLKPIRHYYL